MKYKKPEIKLGSQLQATKQIRLRLANEIILDVKSQSDLQLQNVTKCLKGKTKQKLLDNRSIKC